MARLRDLLGRFRTMVQPVTPDHVAYVARYTHPSRVMRTFTVHGLDADDAQNRAIDLATAPAMDGWKLLDVVTVGAARARMEGRRDA